MKNTLKTIMALSFPLIAICIVFNIGILKTIKETRTMRGPALEKITYTQKIVSL